MKGSTAIQGFVLTAAMAAVPVTQAAAADDPGWYFGASGGVSDTDENVTRKGSDIRVDDSDTMWKAFAGFQFNPNFAVEAAWVDMGELQATIDGQRTDYELEGGTLQVVGYTPMTGGLRAFGKLGAFAWDANATGNAADNSDTDLVGGLGAGWFMNETFGLRLEWERYGGDIETDTVSAGAILHF